MIEITEAFFADPKAKLTFRGFKCDNPKVMKAAKEFVDTNDHYQKYLRQKKINRRPECLPDTEEILWRFSGTLFGIEREGHKMGVIVRKERYDLLREEFGLSDTQQVWEIEPTLFSIKDYRFVYAPKRPIGFKTSKYNPITLSIEEKEQTWEPRLTDYRDFLCVFTPDDENDWDRNQFGEWCNSISLNVPEKPIEVWIREDYLLGNRGYEAKLNAFKNEIKKSCLEPAEKRVTTYQEKDAQHTRWKKCQVPIFDNTPYKGPRSVDPRIKRAQEEQKKRQNEEKKDQKE